MQAAERNLDEKFREWTRREQRLRQERVTEGVLEVLGGFEACQDAPPPPRPHPEA
jgi:F0F1-type ATP synthase gamma subunit